MSKLHVSTDDLTILGITSSEVKHLSSQQQLELYKKKYRKLAIRYHPDKNLDDHDGSIANKFKEVSAAYQRLANPLSNEHYLAEFNQYFNATETIVLPPSTVDIRLEVLIKEELAELKNQFQRLATTAQKQQFSQHYQAFVNLANTLNKNSKTISTTRMNYVHQVFSTYHMILSQLWRENILEILGEEQYDDFEYREAIALGGLWSVLATRKILNPIKLIAALIMTCLAPIKAAFCYYQLNLVKTSITKFTGLLNKWQQKQYNWTDIYDLLVSVAILLIPLATIITMAYVSIHLYSLLLVIPLLNMVCPLLSCPTNKLVRPLLNRLGPEHSLSKIIAYSVPVIILASLATILGGLALLIYMPSILPTSLLACMPYLLSTQVLNNIGQFIILISTAYTLYAAVRVEINLFKDNPELAILNCCITVLAIMLYLFFVPDLNVGATVGLVEGIAISVSGALFSHYVLQIVNKGSEFFNAILNKMPMPSEKLDKQHKTTVNKYINYTFYSHDLFALPRNAPPIPNKDRSLWQQSQHFFGFRLSRSSRPTFAVPAKEEGEDNTLLEQSCINTC